MQSLFIYALVGGSLGAMLGSFNKCHSGACLLTANWRRGALSGTAIVLLFCLATGCGGGSAAMNQSTANVTHITDAEFDADVTQASQPVVVDCYATWCGPCRQLAPIVDGLADEYVGKIKFYKVNVDESPKVSQKYQIQAIPTLLFFKNGKLADTSVGLLSKSDLAGKLEALLASTAPTAAPGH